MRELLVEQVDNRYAYCKDTDGRKTRILLIRMRPRKNGYYLKAESPAKYVEVPSESTDQKYWVWTGDLFSPAHCPCENFRWEPRKPGEVYYCKHLKKVLLGEGMS